MKRFLMLLLGVALPMLIWAQPAKYSITDKKAIKSYEEATNAYNLYEFDEALRCLDVALDRSAAFVEAYLLQSQILSERGNTPGAIESLENALKVNPNFYPEAYYFLGEMHLYEGQYDQAEASFRDYLGRNPSSEETTLRARLGVKSCEFARKALANPVPFDPVNLGPGVNSENPEYYPCLTADESTLLFTREITTPRAMGGRQEDFFVSQSTGKGEWGTAVGMGEINSIMNEGAPTLSPDGQVLIFTACEIDGDWGPERAGLGSCDLFFSQRVGQNWSKPLNLGQKVNSYYWDSQPSIASDGRTLYFVRGKFTPSGISGQDIWVSRLSEGGEWQKPVKVPGQVNTPFEEESVLIHPDGKTLYFSSNGHPGMGGLDIYMSRREANGDWGKPVNLGYPINTHKNENSLLVSATGDIAYFASDREGGYGKLDLYSFEMPESMRPDRVTYVKGEVIDAVSFKKLQAKFQLIDLETGEVAVESYSDSKTGAFLVCLPVNRDYALNVSRPGYLFYSDNFSLTEVTTTEPFYLEVPLEKIKPGSKVVLNNIFFDTDKYDLKPRSKVELSKLVEFLNLNPVLTIEIGGHTDSVGSDAANQTLSDNRAQAVVDYLIESGVTTERLTAKGYGESQPIADNNTEAGRAMNRRTEFKVTQ